MNTLCPPKSKLKSLSHGLLSEDESGELLRHLDQCDSCQHEIQIVESGDDTLIKQIKTSAKEATGTFENEAECKIAGVKALAALGAEVNASTANGFELPQQIGDYEIVRPLGRGGMGQVYLGRHSKLERLVAIKCIATHRQFDETAQQRFAAEMKHIGSLSHPNIVQAFDARELDGTAVLVTEYIDGLDVNQIVKRQPTLHVGDACKIAIEVCAALEYVDSMGMIHRDVKPSNIMVDKNGQVKLLDLGLARLQSGDGGHELTATGQAIGTLDYVAPEQINLSKDVDCRTDIYSLGCTLYKLLTGHAPFDSESYPTALAKLNAHMNDQPTPAGGNVEVPSKLQKLLSQMLHKSPDKRPQSYAEIKNVLKAYAAKSDLKQLVSTALEKKNEPYVQNVRPASKTNGKRNHRWPRLLWIGGALAGIIIGAWMVMVLMPQNPSGEAEKAAASKNEVDVELVSSDPVLAGADVGDLTDLWQEPFWSKETGLIRRNLIAGKKPIVSIKPEESDGKKTGDFVVTVSLNEQERVALASARDRNLDTVLLGFNVENYVMNAVAKLEGAYRVTAVLKNKFFEVRNGFCVVFKRKEMFVLSGGEVSLAKIDYYSRMQHSFGVFQQFKIDRFGVHEQESGTDSTKQTIGLFEFGDSGKVKLAMVVQQRDEFGQPVTFDDAFQEIRLERIIEPAGELEAQALAMLTNASKAGLRRQTGAEVPAFSIHTAFEKGEGEIPQGFEEVEVDVFQSSKRKIWISKQPHLTNDNFATAELSDYLGGCVQLRLTPVGGERSWAELSRLEGAILFVSKVNGQVVSAFQSSGGTSGWDCHVGETGRSFGLGVEDSQLKKWVKQINDSKQLKTAATGNAERENVSKENLKKENAKGYGDAHIQDVARAFLLYEGSYQTFPASKMVTEKNGKDTKPYSWRVALLPFLDQHALYKQYRFDEQWDSAHNKKLLDKMPDVYRHRSAPKDSTTTWYVGFADDDSALQIEKGANWKMIPDGTANTLLLVETDSAIPWTKPEDLPFTDQGMARAMNGSKNLHKNEGIWISRADGSSYFLAPQEAKKNLRKMITRAGGEVFED